MLNLNADLLYNNCLSHHFSEFQWTPALSGKLILGFQKHRKPVCSILKICLGEHAPRSPYVAQAFGTRKAPCAAKKYRVRCFQNYVRYFKNLSKTLQYDVFWLVVRGVILSVTLRRAHEACDMASQASAKTKPSTRLSVFVWKRIFFPPISPTVHLYSVKTITESSIFSKTLSRVKIFENAGHSFTCGRTKT